MPLLQVFSMTIMYSTTIVLVFFQKSSFYQCYIINAIINDTLIGGLEHFLFFHILGCHNPN